MSICLAHIYTCLEFKTILITIASLSKKDRTEISRSSFIRHAIANEKKALFLHFIDKAWQVTSNEGTPIGSQMLDYMPKLFNEVNIVVDSDRIKSVPNQNIEDYQAKVVLALIAKLPSHTVLSLHVLYKNRKKMLNFDLLARALKKNRQTFNRFKLVGLAHDQYRKLLACREGLIYMIQNSREVIMRDTYIDLRNDKKFKVKLSYAKL